MYACAELRAADHRVAKSGTTVPSQITQLQRLLQRQAEIEGKINEFTDAERAEAAQLQRDNNETTKMARHSSFFTNPFRATRGAYKIQHAARTYRARTSGSPKRVVHWYARRALYKAFARFTNRVFN